MGGAPGRTLSDSDCVSDVECSDGLFCNGAELCEPTNPDADAFGCVAARRTPTCQDENDCTVDTCSNELGRCEFLSPDEDGDGHRSASCEDNEGNPLGDDCDDDDGARFPGNVEVCDADDHDEDCDPSTFGERDRDGDGEFDAECCNADDEDDYCGTDCDDLSIARRSRQPEFCDDIDNDCNGEIDDDAGPIPWYPDLDQDLFGSLISDPPMSCAPLVGHSILGTDCEDEVASLHPGQIEFCDFFDNDCDGLIDEPAYCDQGGDVIDGSGGGPSGAGGASGSGGDDGSGGEQSSGGAGSGGEQSSGGAGSGGAGSGGDDGSGGEQSSGGAGSGGAGSGGAGSGGAGSGGGGNADPDCVEALYGRYILREDGYAIYYASASTSTPIVDENGSLIDDFTSLMDGAYHGCGSRASGKVACWPTTSAGANTYGQLGNGDTSDEPAIYHGAEVLIAPDTPLTGVVSVATSGYGAQNLNTSCALTSEGEVWCWGTLYYLLPNSGTSAFAVRMLADDAQTPLSDVDQLAMGPNTVCVRKAGDVYCWGQLTTSQGFLSYPTKVGNLADATDVTDSSNVSCAVTAGQVKCWGTNSSGEVGNNSTNSPVTLASTVRLVDDSALTGIVGVYAGYSRSAALDGDGNLWMWGYDRNYADIFATEVVSVGTPEGANVYGTTDTRYLTSDQVYHIGSNNFAAASYCGPF
jgi:hypothetical protein